jgi:hypothetical protein
VLLEGDGKGNFTYTPQLQAGIQLKGCIREMVKLTTADGIDLMLVGINSQPPVFLKY